MNNGRISVQKYEGVFYRKSVKRQHEGCADKSYSICYNHLGRKYWKTLGWASQGMTAPKAYQIRLEILGRLRQGEDPKRLNKPQHCTVDQAVAASLKQSPQDRRCLNKLQHYQRYIQPYCGELLIEQIDCELLNRMKADYLQRLSPESINKIFRILSMAINHAIRTKMCRTINPVSKACGFSWLKADNNGERFLTPAEVRELLKVLKAKSKTWHDMALLSLHSGLRLTEITKIVGQDINPETKTLFVNAKGGQREPVLLTDTALRVLLENRSGPTDLVFTKDNGSPITTAYRSLFTQAVAELGFNEGVTDRRYRVWFHTLRHTFASWLAQEGVDIYALSKLMRHNNLDMTQRYAHLIPDKQRDYLAVISRKIKS
jgi:integrase